MTCSTCTPATRSSLAAPATAVSPLAGAPASLPSRAPLAGVMPPGLDTLKALAPTLDPEVLRLALAAHGSVVAQGLAAQPDLLTVIDYSRPSSEERLWVFDLRRSELLFNELVAHGKNTGEDLARSFSNRYGSLQTSLGVFLGVASP